VAGGDPKETFAGGGDDFVIAGDSSDIVFANEGDDWLEGGAQADTLDGDDGDPFETLGTGHDVLIGGSGDDEAHGEGGDDIIVTGPGMERNEGMRGFDWVTHRGHPQSAEADMNRTLLLPPDRDNLLDRFGLVEGLSGWNHADVLRGDDADAAAMVDNELENVGRIDGLAAVLGDGTRFTGGNVLLGGGASDLIEGRGGNDVIDGDSWLNVRLSVRDKDDPSVQLRSADSMKDLQNDVFAGDIEPGQIRVIREIEATPAGDHIDTAVFSDVRSAYDFSPALTRDRMTVVHARGTTLDGTDTLRGIERLAFADETIETEPVAGNTPATGVVDIDDPTPDENERLTARREFTDADGIDEPTIEYAWQVETAPGVWTTQTSGVTFTPTDAESGLRLRAVATFRDNDGVFETARSEPTAPVGNVNDAPTGQPVLSDLTPREGEMVTALTGSISDLDGLANVAFRYQWQERVGASAPRFVDIPGANDPSFVPDGARVGRALRVAVSFTDNGLTTEQVVSAGSGEVAQAPVPEIVPPGLGALPEPGEGDGAGAAPTAPLPPVSLGTQKPAAPRVLKTRRLVVRSSRQPLTVAADIPQGARVVRIRVFRRGGGSEWIGTAYRSVPGGGRRSFRLTERALRRLKPGRYVVEIRAGASRTSLGAPATRAVTLKRAKSRRA
jgi:hypothetical protein